MSASTSTRVASGKTTGIYRHGAGWQVVVWRGKSQPPIRRAFPLDTPLAEMQRWRLDTLAKLRLKRQIQTGTFAADAARYLKAVVAMPTHKDRTREIQVWVALFGERRRDTLTPADIREARDRWLTEPRSDEDPRPLGPGTVNKRLRALSNLYRVLDGRKADNPARDVEEAPEPDPEPRALDYTTIEQIILAMTDTARSPRRDQKGRGWRPSPSERRPSLSRIRASILAYTGISPSTLARLTAEDVDLEHRLLYLPKRRKGRGVAATAVPLLAPAAIAFKALDAAKGWGAFDLRVLRRAFTSAAKKVGRPRAQVKDLRHSLATVAFELTGSLDVVMALLQHTQKSTTHRYTLAAALAVLQQQAAPLVEHFERRVERRADQDPSISEENRQAGSALRLTVRPEQDRPDLENPQ